tara:strand:+ start:1355 stop:2041 length:687 start_codon:yes stop_codon:yes gene_type:complete
MLEFSIVVPVYNEAKNIIELINEIYEQDFNKYNFEVIFIDDKSQDNTADLLRAVNKKNFKFIINNKNHGQSYSILKGIQLAKYITIVTLDGDGQNDPSDIAKLLYYFFERNDVQLVGGIRKKRKDNLIKVISSKIANYIRSRLLNDNCSDTGCSLKIFNKEIFLKFPFFNGIHRFLPAMFSGYGYKTAFLNVNHRERKFGLSNYGTIDRLFKGIMDIIKVKKILKNIK